RGQPIIGAIARLYLTAQTTTERLLVSGDPTLYVVENVVAFGEDEGQPDDDHLSETQASPIAVGREALINQFGHPHLKQKCDDDRNIIYSFVGCSTDLSVHPTNLTQFSFSREFSRETSVKGH